jgi:hypothetical protein
MFRKLLVCCTLVLVPAVGRPQDPKSSATVLMLERMDRRFDEVNQKLVTDLTELKAAQKDILQQLRRLDRLEQQSADMQAKMATLEARIAAVENRRPEPDFVVRSASDPVPPPAPPPTAISPENFKRMDAVIDKAVQGMKRAEDRLDAAAAHAEERAKSPVRVNDRPPVQYVAYPVYYYPPPVYQPYPGW